MEANGEGAPEEGYLKILALGNWFFNASQRKNASFRLHLEGLLVSIDCCALCKISHKMTIGNAA